MNTTRSLIVLVFVAAASLLILFLLAPKLASVSRQANEAAGSPSARPLPVTARDPEPEALCPEGKSRPRGPTSGCCWAMQDWDGQHCTGTPLCLDGYSLDLKRNECFNAPCLPGQSRLDERTRCCWPGQTFDPRLNSCAGKAACPAWTEADGRHCRISDWKLVRAGQFMMGCVTGDSECGAEEYPAHQVRISHDFTMMQYPVTVRQFRAYAAETQVSVPAQPKWNDEDHPLVNVTWEEARTFCSWSHGRLPTEAEWEFAARGFDTTSKFVTGSDIDHRQANFWGTESKDQWDYTSPVGVFGMKTANELSEMAGNASQWVADGYQADYYAHSPAENPLATDPDGKAVTRGGSWRDTTRFLRVSARGREMKAARRDTVGFRCVQDFIYRPPNNYD